MLAKSPVISETEALGGSEFQIYFYSFFFFFFFYALCVILGDCAFVGDWKGRLLMT